MLKGISPQINRVALLFDSDNPSWIVYARAIEAAAPSLGVQLIPANVHEEAEIERTVETFAREPTSGLVLLPAPTTVGSRDQIIMLAARHRLPAIYPYRFFTVAGGLVSYGVDLTDLYRRAASYVDRILRGEKPADLPVQQPTKFELIINHKTAKALGVTVPTALLAIADEVFE